MWFTRKTHSNDDKILSLLKEMAAEVAIYGEKVTKMGQNLVSLRGLVNRKLGNTPEQIDNDDGFGEIRRNNRVFPAHTPFV